MLVWNKDSRTHSRRAFRLYTFGVTCSLTRNVIKLPVCKMFFSCSKMAVIQTALQISKFLSYSEINPGKSKYRWMQLFCSL